MSSASIQHDGASQRFSTQVDGHTGYVEYERDGDTLVITHTIVPSAIGGRGIAGELVQAVADHARADGLKVRPQCSYAADWFGKHPQYADLLQG